MPNPTFDTTLPDTVLPSAVIAAQTTGQDLWVAPALCVALHVIDLPIRGHRQRLAALPFALEENTARPIEEAHFALCGSHDHGRTIAAVLTITAMSAALRAAKGRGITAEQFLLPIPPPEGGVARWCVWRNGERLLVRSSDGSGFAVGLNMFAHLWNHASRPAIENYGQALPERFRAMDRTAEELPPVAVLPDLRQGQFAKPGQLRRPLIAMASVLALAVLGNIGLLYADLHRQSATVTALTAEASALIARNIPAARVTDNPRLLYRRLAASTDGAPGFLSVFGRAAQALGTSPVQLTDLSWSSREAVLVMQAEANSIDSLQSAEAALRAANLDVTAGAFTAGAGSARMRLTIRATP